MFCVSEGEGQFGEKCVGDLAVEYMEASRHNLHKFQPPQVIFVFFDGITDSIARETPTTPSITVGSYHHVYVHCICISKPALLIHYTRTYNYVHV